MNIVSALVEPVLCTVQCEDPAAFQNVEGFVRQKVSVYRNARTDGTCWVPKARSSEPVAGPTLMKMLPVSRQ